MRAIHVLALACLLAAAPAFAEEPPPTDASLRELIQLSGADTILDKMRPRIEDQMRQVMQQVLQGKKVSAEQQQVLDEMMQEVVALIVGTLNWESFEPLMLDIYRKSFNQAEVDGMNDFYRTEVGRAVVAKMPVVMEHAMAAVQKDMIDLLPKLETVQKRAMERLKALDTPQG